MENRVLAFQHLGEAYALLSTFELGRIRSIQYHPDKVQNSHSQLYFTASTPDGDLDLTVHSREQFLFIRAATAIRELCDLYSKNERFQAFYANRIGISDRASDTDDRFILSTSDLAKHFRRSRRAIQYWISEVENDFERILVSRKLLADENNT